MRSPHFFKAKSRLGTHKPPHRQEKVNFGVEEGPDAILSSDFINTFASADVSTFDFPLPETIDSAHLIPAIAVYYQEMKKKINNLLVELDAAGSIPVTHPFDKLRVC